MSLVLGALTLNDGAPGSPAIRLRYNRVLPLSAPEWIGQGTATAAVCYALDRIGASGITVRAHLQATGAEAGRPLEVRAISHAPPRFSWWPSSVVPALTWPDAASTAYWLALYRALGSTPEPAAQDGPFGHVAPAGIDVPANGRLDHDFTVTNVRLAQHGIDAHTVRWRWQYRHASSDGWTDFAFTQFTVFVVLTTPTLPWVQLPATPLNTQLPWVEVLALACRWAAGATTVEAAGARITEAVNGLGRTGTLAYDCEGTDVTRIGTPHYTLLPGVFECSGFIERVRGGLGNGRFVNCTDCASAVSTFANVLGCDLSQSRMFGPVPFPLNPTRSIGSLTWLSACAIGTYSMHEVAWTGNCGEDDSVYDACLELDGDDDPTRAPHQAQLPVNMRFGAPGEGLYRDRLASPPGRLLCEPQPFFRQRRFIV